MVVLRTWESTREAVGFGFVAGVVGSLVASANTVAPACGVLLRMVAFEFRGFIPVGSIEVSGVAVWAPPNVLPGGVVTVLCCVLGDAAPVVLARFCCSSAS